MKGGRALGLGNGNAIATAQVMGGRSLAQAMRPGSSRAQFRWSGTSARRSDMSASTSDKTFLPDAKSQNGEQSRNPNFVKEERGGPGFRGARASGPSQPPRAQQHAKHVTCRLDNFTDSYRPFHISTHAPISLPCSIALCGAAPSPMCGASVYGHILPVPVLSLQIIYQHR